MTTPLYAQPTKEWVIPPRPKPGRKRKAETVDAPSASKRPAPATINGSLASGSKLDPSADYDPEDDASKKTHNRAAQRAFRERKQTQIADLQARITAYEHGEIERNVALQAVAQKLKEENEALKKENECLKREIAVLREAKPTVEVTTKREPRSTTKKGGRAVRGRPTAHVRASSIFSTSSSITNSTAVASSSLLDSASTTSTVATSVSSPSIKLDVSASFPDLSASYPPYAPALPLRNRRAPSGAAKAVSWLLVPPTSDSAPTRMDFAPSTDNAASEPSCTGDPSNCSACADDPSNQAFCAALGDAYGGVRDHHDADAIRAQSPPPTSNAVAPPPFPVDEDAGMDVDAEIHQHSHVGMSLCCGDPNLCGGGGCGVPSDSALIPTLDLTSISGPSLSLPSFASFIDQVAVSSSSEGALVLKAEDETSTVPCNTAWAQLRQHPNIAFADLSLLADVVARAGPASHSERKSDEGRRLVPPDKLFRTHGERVRVREVQSAGVRDALRVLDGVRSLK